VYFKKNNGFKYVVVNGYYYVKWETYKVKTKITKPVINIKFRYATSRLDEKSTITIDKKLFVHVETIIFFKVKIRVIKHFIHSADLHYSLNMLKMPSRYNT
jgi:hypothetical protein